MSLKHTPRAFSARTAFGLVVCGLLALTASGPASAEGQTPDPALVIELNKAEQLEDTCRDVPTNRMRVRQFDLPQTQCASIGMVLINSAAACKGDGIVADACMESLDAKTRIDMELSG